MLIGIFVVLGVLLEYIWECIGYYELRKHKPWFNEGSATLLDQRKRANLLDASKIRGGNLNNVTPDANRHLRIKCGNTFGAKLNSKISGFYGGHFGMLCHETLVRTDVSEECIASRPPLWSSGQSSWLLTQRSGFDSRRYQIFWVAVGLDRSPLSPCDSKWVATWKKSSGSGLENWD
jgi:hypothetical protein